MSKRDILMLIKYTKHLYGTYMKNVSLFWLSRKVPEDPINITHINNDQSLYPWQKKIFTYKIFRCLK